MKTPEDPTSPANAAQNEPEQIPFELDVTMVKQMLDAGDDFLLIDCRRQDEFDHCRIEGSVLIPMDETPSRLDEIEAYRGRTIVVHCHHGGRSGQIVEWLRGQGFTYSQNMSGGIDAWSLEIDTSIPRY